MEINSKVTTTLNEIAAKARQVDELAAEVAGASREQTQGISQINTAVGQMDKVTQSNAASAEESAAAAQELNAQAAAMKEAVAELSRLVGGDPQAAKVGSKAAAPSPQPWHRTTSVKKPSAPVLQNGRTHARPVPVGAAHERGEIPLEDDFKDF